MDKIEIIKTEMNNLVSRMINTFDIQIEESEGLYHVIIKTEEAPTIIGRHGETIRAIQKIMEVILYKKLGEAVNILVNVNDYREKQKERLESLASQAAERAMSEQKPSYLRGFSSYERKIIHEYITENYPDLTTSSIGEGKDRRLVINLKSNEQESKSEPEA